MTATFGSRRGRPPGRRVTSRPTPRPTRASSARSRSRAPPPRDAHPSSRGRRTAGSWARPGRARSTTSPRLPADRFLDREISWLQFNERVLQLAADETVPLLERARSSRSSRRTSTSSSWCGWRASSAAHRHRHRRALGLRARAARGARADLAGRPRLLSMKARVYGEEAAEQEMRSQAQVEHPDQEHVD